MTPETIIQSSRKNHPREIGPYILLYESAIDFQALSTGKDAELVQQYTFLYNVLERLNEQSPGLELGYCIEQDTKEITRRVTSGSEPVGVLMISARRPEGLSLARLTGFKHASYLPVYLVCDSVAALPVEQRDGIAQVGIEIVDRRQLNMELLERICVERLVPEPETQGSGLKFTELLRGSGPRPKAGAKVTVHYTGMLDDGSVFDSSYSRGEPFQFELGAGIVIDGWDEGIGLMRLGSKAQLIIPPELAYGEKGDGNVIPPNATLIFNVELVDLFQPKKKRGEEEKKEGEEEAEEKSEA